ncbi:peritrophin-1-like [Diorhabda sublineata]|uniref:peritrophin-1-like n=1 Tax=Diorhabda sublineata TaxID=1163346 RepID=UPI0024E07973|nr:peritrophin-1-like [Diorhabda sublineata]
MGFDLKFIFLLSLFVLAVRSEEEAPKCTGRQEYFPSTSDCTKYWQCTPTGQPILRECPDRLVYDSFHNMCNYKSVAGCKTN